MGDGGNVSTIPRARRAGTAVGTAANDAADAPPKTAIGQLASFDTPEIREAVVSGFKRMKALEDERSQINAEMLSIRKNLTSRGLEGKAIAHVYGLWKLEEPKRGSYGETARVLDKALQMDLFPDAAPAIETAPVEAKPVRKPVPSAAAATAEAEGSEGA